MDSAFCEFNDLVGEIGKEGEQYDFLVKFNQNNPTRELTMKCKWLLIKHPFLVHDSDFFKKKQL